MNNEFKQLNKTLHYKSSTFTLRKLGLTFNLFEKNKRPYKALQGRKQAKNGQKLALGKNYNKPKITAFACTKIRHKCIYMHFSLNSYASGEMENLTE